MSGTAFISGPWSVSKTRGKSCVRIDADGWSRLAKVVVRLRGDDEDFSVGVANSHLIAAAPELYEAALALASLDDGKGRTFPTVEQCAQARAALAKARGEPA